MCRRQQGRIVVVVEAKFHTAGMIATRRGAAGKLRNLDPLVQAVFVQVGGRTRNCHRIRPQKQRDACEQEGADRPAEEAHELW
jgi:hypothetical protein